jgi:RNA polymerase sigma-70 factor (sigma-E family)
MDYEGFFADHYDEVVRTLALVTGDRERAEDAAQEAFAKAFRRWPDVAHMERPVGWVVVVATNRLRRWIGRHDRRFHAASAPDATLAPPPDHADAVASAAAVRAALGRLAPRQRAVVVLRYLCDLPTAEVADALGVSPGTVKSALHAGLANLRVHLDDLPTDHDLPGVANDAS